MRNFINFEKTLLYWLEKRKISALIPDDHYFHTYFTYNALKLDQYSIAETILQDYSKISNKGHIEFNKYALLSIYEDFPDFINQPAFSEIKQNIFDNKYSVNFTTWTGNNWLFLRTIIHLKLFVLTQNKSEWKNFNKYFDYIIKFYDSGLFYDFPAASRLDKNQNKSFPLAYSFKMLASLIEIYQILLENQLYFEKLPILDSIISNSAGYHLNLISPDGESLFYGRSDNTLFGYGNILYFLESMEKTSSINENISKIKNFINTNFSEDKLLTKSLPYNGFRDSYIYDSVYISYFIFKYLKSLEIKTKLKYSPADLYSGKYMTNNAGFIIRDKKYFYFLSSTGCAIPQNDMDFYSYRYTGLTFFKYFNEQNNQNNFLLEVNRKNITDYLSDIPFCPKFVSGCFILTPFVFNNIEHSENQDYIKFSGEARFEILFSSKFLRKIFAVISRKLSINTRYKISLFFKNIISKYFIYLNRNITINKETGSILIKDSSNRKKFIYTIPSNWDIEAENIKTIEFNDNYKKLEIKSKIICIAKNN